MQTFMQSVKELNQAVKKECVNQVAKGHQANQILKRLKKQLKKTKKLCNLNKLLVDYT